MPLQKQYNVKLFGSDGATLRKALSPATLKNLPVFRSRINGGLGQCVLDLNLPFDDFDEGASVAFMNVADVYCVDAANPRGRRIYRGYVSRYEPYLEDAGEGVRVTLLGLASLLTRSYYGSGPGYAVTHTAVDPEAIAKAVLDNFNAAFGGALLSYAGSTATVGANVTTTLTKRKWFDAVNDAKDLAGAGWWWKVDADGLFHFRAKPGSATHAFTIGKDVDRLTCPKDSERVVNEVIVERAGGTPTTYTDAASQAAFGTGSPATGRHTRIVSDAGLANGTTADQRGSKELNDNKGAKVRATIEVNSQYDLESIQVGHTCKVRNVRKADAFFSPNMLVVGLDYRGDACTLELEEHSADLGRELERFVNG